VVGTQSSDRALVSGALRQVFACLNYPANADIFIEAARYQRIEQ
jgi:hypothetical protein